MILHTSIAVSCQLPGSREQFQLTQIIQQFGLEFIEALM